MTAVAAVGIRTKLPNTTAEATTRIRRTIPPDEQHVASVGEAPHSERHHGIRGEIACLDPPHSGAGSNPARPTELAGICDGAVLSLPGVRDAAVRGHLVAALGLGFEIMLRREVPPEVSRGSRWDICQALARRQPELFSGKGSSPAHGPDDSGGRQTASHPVHRRHGWLSRCTSPLPLRPPDADRGRLPVARPRRCRASSHDRRVWRERS